MYEITCRYCPALYKGTTRREASDQLEAHVMANHAQEHEDTRFQNPQYRNMN